MRQGLMHTPIRLVICLGFSFLGFLVFGSSPLFSVFSVLKPLTFRLRRRPRIPLKTFDSQMGDTWSTFS